MIARILHFILRILGWLLSPLVITAAAILGATAGFAIAADWVPTTGVLFALGCGLVAALTCCLLWLRLLRRSPKLREALAVTASGLPESDVVHDMLQAVALEDKPAQEDNPALEDKPEDKPPT